MRIGLATAVIGATAVIALVAAGCGGSVVKQSSEEDLVTQTFQKQGLPAPESIDCPDNVDAKVGETFECTATVKGGQTLTLSAKITKKTDNGVIMTVTGLKRGG